MIKIEVSVKGLRTVVKNIETLGVRKTAKIRNILEDTAWAIQRESRRSMQMTKKGEAQVRYEPKRTVYPSLPGNPPAIDKGSLIDNVVVDLKKMNSVEVGLRDTKDAIHGLRLERGTKKIEKRPWFEPAINKMKPIMEKSIDNMMKNK